MTRPYPLATLFFFMACFAGCSAGGGDDMSSDPSTAEDAGDGPGVDAGKRDAGKPPGTPLDAGLVHKDAGSPKDAAVISVDSGLKDASAADHCTKLACTNVLDCIIGHPDALDCGFTACTNMVCTK